MSLDSPLITGEFEDLKPERSTDREVWLADWRKRRDHHRAVGLRPVHNIGRKQTPRLTRYSALWMTDDEHFLLSRREDGWHVVTTDKATWFELDLVNGKKLDPFPSVMAALDYLSAHRGVLTE